MGHMSTGLANARFRQLLGIPLFPSADAATPTASRP